MPSLFYHSSKSSGPVEQVPYSTSEQLALYQELFEVYEHWLASYSLWSKSKGYTISRQDIVTLNIRYTYVMAVLSLPNGLIPEWKPAAWMAAHMWRLFHRILRKHRARGLLPAVMPPSFYGGHAALIPYHLKIRDAWPQMEVKERYEVFDKSKAFPNEYLGFGQGVGDEFIIEKSKSDPRAIWLWVPNFETGTYDFLYDPRIFGALTDPELAQSREAFNNFLVKTWGRGAYGSALSTSDEIIACITCPIWATLGFAFMMLIAIPLFLKVFIFDYCRRLPKNEGDGPVNRFGAYFKKPADKVLKYEKEEKKRKKAFLQDDGVVQGLRDKFPSGTKFTVHEELFEHTHMLYCLLNLIPWPHMCSSGGSLTGLIPFDTEKYSNPSRQMFVRIEVPEEHGLPAPMDPLEWIFSVERLVLPSKGTYSSRVGMLDEYEACSGIFC